MVAVVGTLASWQQVPQRHVCHGLLGREGGCRSCNFTYRGLGGEEGRNGGQDQVRSEQSLLVVRLASIDWTRKLLV